LKGGEYAAAYRSAVYFRRSDRVLRCVPGKSPSQTMSGILSGSMPRDLRASADSGELSGRAPWSAILSPKGKMISDVRVSRLGNGEPGSLLLDLPAAGAAEAFAHFARFLPPRLARIEELGEPAGVITVVGPGAAALLASEASPLGPGALDLAALDEGDERVVPDASETGFRVIRTARAVPPSFDVVASAAALARLEESFAQRGVAEVTEGLGEVLRVERGFPAFGAEMDADTIPLEVGGESRYIDHGKGCYTGQEVIVRIRDRGHVNRLLRGVFLSDGPLPAAGTPLVVPGEARTVGETRSAVWSPGFEQGIALAFVRREIVPPATLALGSADGPSVSVRELTADGWRLVPGDASLHPSPPEHPAT
jgi:folate-binding protein YgfZ